MDKSKKKLVNFRLPFALFLSLTCGIAFTYAFFYFKTDKLYLLTAVPIAAVFFIISALATKGRTFSMAIIALTFILGAGFCFLRMNSYATSQTDDCVYTVTGKVIDRGSLRAYDYLIITDAYAGDIKLDGDLYVQVYEGAGEGCDIGYSVRFDAKVNKYDLILYGKLNYRAPDNVKYYAAVSGGGLYSTYGFSLFGSIRSGIYDTLFDNASYDTAAVGYAMLTGDTSCIEEQTLSAFRYGGVAHVFAVSGLHIGILFALLSFITDKLNIRGKAGSLIIILLIFFYTGICGFSPSSLRSAIMCSFSLLARMIRHKYDSINALSMSGLLLLLINPLYLFEVGFQMSFAAVYSALFLSRNVRKFLSFLPYKANKILGYGICAQLAILPIQLINFGYFPYSALLVNLLIVPILSVIYVIALCCSIFSMIFTFWASPVMQTMCTVFEAFLSLLVRSGVDSSALGGVGGWCMVIFIAIFIIALSDRFNFTRFFRGCAAFTVVGAMAVYMFLCRYMPLGDARIIVSAYYGGGAVIVRNGSCSVLIVTEDMTVTKLATTVNYYCPDGLDGIIILGGDDCLERYYFLGVTSDDVYVYDGYIPMDAPGIAAVHYENAFSVGGVTYKFADGYSVLADVNGIKLGVCAGETTAITRCDMLVSRYAFSGVYAGEKVYFNLKHHQNNIYDCGDLQFSVNSGTISKIGLSHYVQSGG